MKTIDPTAFLRSVETAFEQRVTNVALQTAFRELPEWDSLASVMIVAEIYADHGVQISGEELERCRTLADLKSLIESKL
jgi:acyl carrier protein